jgi:hypothetical protein
VTRHELVGDPFAASLVINVELLVWRRGLIEYQFFIDETKIWRNEGFGFFEIHTS